MAPTTETPGLVLVSDSGDVISVTQAGSQWLAELGGERLQSLHSSRRSDARGVSRPAPVARKREPIERTRVRGHDEMMRVKPS